MEESRGLSLRPLISELAAELRAGAPEGARGLTIDLDLETVYTTQDVAVAVAFLITEIVEFAMLCGADLVSVVLEGAGPGSARLSIEAAALVEPIECDTALADRFERIVTGLARQLRSALERDPTRGRYSVLVGVVEGETEA